MKFQNMDSNLHAYNDYFSFHKGSGYNFVLKPNNLRKDIIPAEPIPEDTPLHEQRLYRFQKKEEELNGYGDGA